MSPRHWIGIGALAMFLAVAAGAFGAHGLKERVDAEHLAIWHTAVQYHALHALALVAHGIRRERVECGAAPAYLLSAGILLFSGSLYGLALGGPSWLGPITPLGGAAFLGGWLAFAVQALRR
jgi:uncharacterized membrane protein YgdD (TMEM256/DUF423 family)